MRVFFSGTSPRISASTTLAHQQITNAPLLSVFKMLLVRAMGVLFGVKDLLIIEEPSGAENCPTT